MTRFRTLTGLGLMLAIAAATAAPTPHTEFQTQLRAVVLKGMSTTQWASNCFMGSNGLPAKLRVVLHENGTADAVTDYYRDAECKVSAGLTERQSGTFSPTTARPDLFVVAGKFDVMSAKGMLVYRQGNDVLHLRAEGILR